MWGSGGYWVYWVKQGYIGYGGYGGYGGGVGGVWGVLRRGNGSIQDFWGIRIITHILIFIGIPFF